MNLGGLVHSFPTGTYTVTRHAPTTAGTDGRGSAGAATTFDIEASVQGLGGRELQMLPEGMRSKEVQKLYTTTRLQSIGDPDVIRLENGEDWQVYNVDDNQILGGYFKCLIMKVGN